MKMDSVDNNQHEAVTKQNHMCKMCKKSFTRKDTLKNQEIHETTKQPTESGTFSLFWQKTWNPT